MSTPKGKYMHFKFFCKSTDTNLKNCNVKFGVAYEKEASFSKIRGGRRDC